MGTVESGSLRCFFGTLQSLIRYMVMEILHAGKIPEEQQEQQQEYNTIVYNIITPYYPHITHILHHITKTILGGG